VVKSVDVNPNVRLADCAHAWRVSIANIVETDTSLLAFGRRANDPVVLKMVKRAGDEWDSGDIVAAFNGTGVVRLFEHTGGALLLERLTPATPLVSVVQDERDSEATDVLAGLIDEIRGTEAPARCPTVRQWGDGFDRYLASGDKQISRELVNEARDHYLRLCGSQQRVQLLHADLHHYNVLWDSVRGWTAVDPKGVVGEIEYEIGAALRNPIEMPDGVTSPPRIRNRVDRFSSRLSLDAERVLGWAFAQAVLSAIWGVEDGRAVDASNVGLRLARTIGTLLGRRV
jgi:streptomycin 6-kinase